MVRVLNEQFWFEGGLSHVVLVGAERVVSGEEQKYILGDLQLLDAAVDHVDLLGHFLVAAVGPDLQTAVLQLLHVGVLQLVEEQHFDVGDVLGVVLEVGLLQVCLAQLCGGREGVQPPDLLPDPGPLLLALDVRFLGLLVDAHLDGLREQFALSLAELHGVESDILPWVFFLVNLLVDVDAHDDQLGGAHHQKALLGGVLDEADLVDGADALLVDVSLRDVVVADDEQLVGGQVLPEAADPELVGLLGEHGDDVVLLLVVLDDEVDALPVEHLDEVDHLPGLLVEHAQVPPAVAHHRQALLRQHRGLLHACLAGVELLHLFVEVQDHQLPGGRDYGAVAAGAVDGDVERRVLVGVDEGVDFLFVFRDVLDLRAFVHLVFVVATGVALGDVELEDFAVVGDGEEVAVGGFEYSVDNVVAGESDPVDGVEWFVVLACVFLL